MCVCVCIVGVWIHVLPLSCVARWSLSTAGWLSLYLSSSFSDDMTMSLIPQFGTSFATFRPALSHSGSTRPLSVILPVPASPPYNCPPGSSSSSPTSKVPMWKVCSPFASISSVAPFLPFLFKKIQLSYHRVCSLLTLITQLTHSNHIALLP